MKKISSIGMSAAIITGLLIFAATTNSVLAVPPMPSHQMNKIKSNESNQMMAQMLGGKNVKIGNMTLGFRPGVMVMPLLCMSVSGNMSGIPMLGNMMKQNMNQSSMMMGSGAQGNQSMTGLGAMMMHGGMVPSVCFSMSDAMLFRSMMMHGESMNGIMGGNMTGSQAMMGGVK